MQSNQNHIEESGPGDLAAASQFADAIPPEGFPAWEEVDAGRYMPRRIKGSYKGRALG